MKEGMGGYSDTRGVSRWLLGLVFLLLFGTHVALPCASAFSKGLSPRGGMCREDGLARAPVSTNTYFMVPMPQPLQLAAIAALSAFAASAVIVLVLAKPSRIPLAASSRGRPFASSDPPHLSYFGAQRDA